MTPKVGDRLRDIHSSFPVIVIVTALTERGFAYRAEQPVFLGPRHGWWQDGECFESGYANWTPAKEEDKMALDMAPQVTYHQTTWTTSP